MPVAPAPQPFLKHPLPSLLTHLLAADLGVVKGALNADFLLVPPPSADDVDTNGGSVVRSLLGSVYVRNSGAAPTAAVTDVQLVYKAEGSKEVLLANLPAAVLAVGAATTLTPTFNPILKPTDRGIFLRVANVATVDAFANFGDLRGPALVEADLTDALSTVLANAAAAVTLLPTPTGYGAGFGVENFDTVAHTFHIFLTDGTTTIELTDTAVPVSVAAGAAAVLPLAGNGFAPVLPPGWSLKAQLGEAVTTTDPRISFGYVPTNEAPARDDQAGAY